VSNTPGNLPEIYKVSWNFSGLVCEFTRLLLILVAILVFHSVSLQTRMWANVQRDGRPAEYRWRPLFNTAVWLTPTIRVPCSNAAKTRNPLKLPRVPQTNETISAASGPKFTIF